VSNWDNIQNNTMRMTRNQKARPGAPLVDVVGIEDQYYPHVMLACGDYVEMKPTQLNIGSYLLPKRLRCNDCAGRKERGEL
jgi:hypothetical protein